MIFVLSPSKSVTEKPTPLSITETPLLFEQQAMQLVIALHRQPLSQLRNTLQVSENIAKLNYLRYTKWQQTATKPALWLYSGDVYNGIDAFSLTEDDVQFAQEHVLIVSGMYGLVRPTDGIKPYRLEMKLPFAGEWGNNLYQAWCDKIANFIDKQNEKYVVLAASNEYAKAVTQKLPKHIKTITPKFKQEAADGLKEKGLFSKYARGRLVRYAIDNRIQDPEALKSYDIDGFKFAPDLSTESEYVYIVPKDFTLKGRFTKQ
jgi:cytoplasmic iron level regulating protein YaaA (DUF328/UPF0246 family)